MTANQTDQVKKTTVSRNGSFKVLEFIPLLVNIFSVQTNRLADVVFMKLMEQW